MATPNRFNEKIVIVCTSSDGTTNGIEILDSSNVTVYKVDSDGNITSLSLSGTGNRVVTVDANGKQSATLTTVSKYITDSTTITLLTTAGNWNNDTGVYTGTTLDSNYAFVGAVYDLHADYKYEIGSNGLPYRLPKV